MTVLSLIEAAEQAATSKVDVWRAIQDGALPAQKTGDGGYAIDPADLFRVFERKKPEPSQAPEDAAPSADAPPVAKTDEAREPSATEDVSEAFAALQAELKTLLGPLAEPSRTGQKRRRAEPKERANDLADENARLAADLAAEKAKSGKVIAEYAALAEKLETLVETRRPWWRRLKG